MSKFKKLVLTIALTLMFNCLWAQWTQIPDQNLELALIQNNLDFNLDGQVLTIALNSIVNIDLSNRNISDLTGIEEMINLQAINLNNNDIDIIDLSHSPNLEVLNCSNNLLTELDVSDYENLQYLGCANNFIENLDLSNNFSLEELLCNNNGMHSLVLPESIINVDASNNNLIDINVQDCPNLNILSISYNNFFKLEILDLSNNPSLIQLNCASSRLNEIQIKECTNLISIDCSGNSLTGLDISNNLNLFFVDVSLNFIESLNVSLNTQLQSLRINNNETLFGTLDLTNQINLVEFNGQFTELECIQVLNSDDANNGLGNYSNWAKSEVTQYSENCNVFSRMFIGKNIEEIGVRQQQLYIYPMPVDELIYFRFNSNLKDKKNMLINSIELYDSKGNRLKKYHQLNNNCINISDLADGLYFIKVNADSHIFTKKVIISHN